MDEVRTQIGHQARFDACAHLVLIPLGEELLVHVALADGRGAFREVPSAQALWPTVRAVLLLPPPVPAIARGRVLDPANVDSSSPDFDERAPRAGEEPLHPHLELGVGASARFSGGPLYGGAGAAAFADVLLGSWLIGVYGRWDAVDDLITTAEPSGFSMQSFGVGVRLGGRMQISRWSLDGAAGPEVVVDSQDGDGPGDGGGEANDVRLDLGLRFSGPDTSRVRFYVAADVDASPARIRKSAQIDPGLPALPWWSSGIALGLVWGAL